MRWRDVLLMIPLAILAIAFPIVTTHIYTLFFCLGLMFFVWILRVEWCQWRIWPHRINWIHFFVTLYIVISLMWVTCGMFISLLRQYGLL